MLILILKSRLLTKRELRTLVAGEIEPIERLMSKFWIQGTIFSFYFIFLNRTRLILQKLLNTGVITAIHGCVSTGKEANVYSASAPDGNFYAIKVIIILLLIIDL